MHIYVCVYTHVQTLHTYNIKREKEIGRNINNLGAPQVALLVKNLPANEGDARDPGSIPGLGRSPGGGSSNPFQYSCLGNRKAEEPGRL